MMVLYDFFQGYGSLHHPEERGRTGREEGRKERRGRRKKIRKHMIKKRMKKERR